MSYVTYNKANSDIFNIELIVILMNTSSEMKTIVHIYTENNKFLNNVYVICDIIIM